MSDLTKNDTAELLVWLANAKKTGGGALGHNKADRNYEHVERYTEELERRGVPIPTSDDLYKTGVFNGTGSS